LIKIKLKPEEQTGGLNLMSTCLGRTAERWAEFDEYLRL